MMDYDGQLNKEQLDVVMHADGTSLILAGPGSGKTRIIVFRICKILEDGVSPESILLLTFTNKAAREMKRRLRDMTGENADKITAGTFHHFCNRMLRKHASLLGLRNDFTIIDENDGKMILKQIMNDGKDNDMKKSDIETLWKAISLSKLNMIPIKEHLKQNKNEIEDEQMEWAEDIAMRYADTKKRMNALDFDDLLFYTDKLLCEHEEIRKRYQERYQHILVDEYQDTDKLQASIIDRIYAKGNNLLVVGDDFQSIYSFRGAEVKNILGFRKKYGSKVFYLENNYRSTGNIINLVNYCMKASSGGIRKTLKQIGQTGNLPVLIEARDAAEEAWVVAEKIEEMVLDGQNAGVLFRAAYLASEMEVELTRRGIKYEMRGGIRFFEQRHVKDILSVLRVYENAKDASGVVRLLTIFPGIGEIKAVRASKNAQNYLDIIGSLGKIQKKGTDYSESLTEIYKNGKNAAGMLSLFYEKIYSKYMKKEFEDANEREKDIEALIGLASKYENTRDFLSTLVLDEEEPDGEPVQVVLSTIHQAKGLEWDNVFVICAADGMLPIEKATDIEEERRLFYVAVSRAKKGLFVSYPKFIGRFYNSRETQISRFMREIPDNCYSCL